MYCWRITKYNPKYRDINGAYIFDEWTDYSDIGRKSNNEILSFEEYDRVESAYISAIKMFLKRLDINSLQVNSVEKPKIKFDNYVTSQMKQLCKSINENDIVSLEQIEDLCKLICRGYLWAKIKHGDQLLIVFGWDYYMYIGADQECPEVLNKIEALGLFVEPFDLKAYLE